jgi:glycosyltransferase involved in cell wall biosynthesis
MTLRVGVDGYNLALPRGTGISTYARTLAAAIDGMAGEVDLLFGLDIPPGRSALLREVGLFEKLQQDDRKPPRRLRPRRWLRERVFGWRGMDAEEIPLAGIAHGRAGALPPHRRILNIQNLYQVASRHFHRREDFLRIRVPDPPQVMHWTYTLPIRLEGARNIYTVHDMVPLRLPYATLDDKAYHVKLIEGCLREGDGLVTVSQTSQRDIEAMFPQARGRVVNTYQTVVPPAFDLPPAEGLANFLDRLFGLQPRGYFLFYGALEPKKNLARLLEAFLLSGATRPLVVVSAHGWGAEAQAAAMWLARGAAAGRVMQLDFQPAHILQRLVRGARAVLFPSLYEGFGLPAVEAMALGTPCMTSMRGAMPEIGGDAALLVDPCSIAGIADAIEEIERNDQLCRDLAAAGLTRAGYFSEQAYRSRLQTLYARYL